MEFEEVRYGMLMMVWWIWMRAILGVKGKVRGEEEQRVKRKGRAIWP